jgi:hypothetical protein
MSDTGITIIEGNDRDIQITVSDRQAAMDLTGASVQFMVKDVDANGKPVAADSAAIIKKAIGTGVTVVTANQGIILVSLVPADTTGLGRPDKPYKWDVKVKTAAGKEYSTEPAPFVVRDSVAFDNVT